MLVFDCFIYILIETRDFLNVFWIFCVNKSESYVIDEQIVSFLMDLVLLDCWVKIFVSFRRYNSSKQLFRAS